MARKLGEAVVLYGGPMDGHEIPPMVLVLERVLVHRDVDGPDVLHVYDRTDDGRFVFTQTTREE